MSIRLRLTLLYIAILALTLITFSVMLYVIQSQATLDAIKSTLERQARDAQRTNLMRRFPPRSDLPQSTYLPGRWTQIRSVDGSVIRRTADLSDTTLPLSEDGLRAVQQGTSWVETAQVEDDPLLIYSQPIPNAERGTEIVQIAAPIIEREHSLATLRAILIGGNTLAILAAFAIGWGLAGAALQPIHRITQTAQAIGAERDFRRRVQHVRTQ
jgi:CHASE3 domain sensor protein